MDSYIRGKLSDPEKQYYVLIDEIQFVTEVQNPYVEDKTAKLTFVDVLLGWMHLPNVDVYVTGSNSKMLSSDLLTQFRDRGDEVRVFPLSFAEFYETYSGDPRHAWPDYYTYGGMPFVPSLDRHEEKRKKEIASLIRIPDSFDKMVVVREDIKPWRDENGIRYVGVEQFLLHEDVSDYE